MMKRAVMAVLTGLAVVVGGSAVAAEIGVLDMERLIKLHPRTNADREVLEKYVEDFETEREERVTALQALSEDFETLRKSAEDISLSEKAVQEKRRLAQVKFEEMRRAERDLREIAAQRQKELTGQELRMRTRVVADIRQIVEKVVAEQKLTLVLDSTGPGAGGYSPVIFAQKSMDITEAVISRLVKDSPKEDSSKEDSPKKE